MQVEEIIEGLEALKRWLSKIQDTKGGQIIIIQVISQLQALQKKYDNLHTELEVVERDRDKRIDKLQQELAEVKAKFDKEFITRIKYQDKLYKICSLFDGTKSPRENNFTTVDTIVQKVKDLKKSKLPKQTKISE